MKTSWESQNVVSLLICYLTGKASNITVGNDDGNDWLSNYWSANRLHISLFAT